MAMTVGNFKKVQRSHFSLGFALTYLTSMLGSTIKQLDMMSKGTRMWLNLMSFGKRTLKTNFDTRRLVSDLVEINTRAQFINLNARFIICACYFGQF